MAHSEYSFKALSSIPSFHCHTRLEAVTGDLDLPVLAEVASCGNLIPDVGLQMKVMIAVLTLQCPAGIFLCKWVFIS